MRARVIIYKAVIQTVLLYISESWVVTDAMLKVLEGLYHQVDQRITGMSSQKIREGGWGW